MITVSNDHLRKRAEEARGHVRLDVRMLLDVRHHLQIRLERIRLEQIRLENISLGQIELEQIRLESRLGKSRLG